jgi:single-stranded-DNA-specific exonuclease
MTPAPKRWIIARPDPAAQSLARALRLPPPLAQALLNRGLRDADDARRFLQPQLRDLRDPFELPDMQAAVARVCDAIAAGQPTVIYGDYDVDGISSCALLAGVLRAAGANPQVFIPRRMDEGYGLTADGIARCLKQHKPKLLIAVDCGTGSVCEISHLKSQGVDTIVLDHHEPPDRLPDCVALVNPKRRRGNPSPLASVGIAFKLAHALLKRDRRLADTLDLRDQLDLVAVGSVADLVPLTGENRILVKHGLQRLPRTRNPGLRALLEIAGLTGEVSPGHVGFRIGPRLNAAGRVSDAMAALELLTTDDAARARQLAHLLNQHNTDRQRVQERIVLEALTMVQEELDLDREPVLVLARPGWHPGVVGIVAARLQQQFYRPVVVIAVKDGLGKGSCRSVPGFSIVAALRACAPLLESFGGHGMAAGLTIKPAALPRLRRNLNRYAARTLDPADLQPVVRIDAVLRLDELDPAFFRGMNAIEPCGPDNPRPVFALRGAHLRGAPRVVGKNHLRFQLTDGKSTVPAIWWNMAGAALPTGPLDIAGVPDLDEYQGVESVQLIVKDIRPAQP